MVSFWSSTVTSCLIAALEDGGRFSIQIEDPQFDTALVDPTLDK